MVMWSGTEVVNYLTDMLSGTEVVDNVPDILPYGHVEWYRGCGLCTRHYHMIMWSGTEVVDYVPDITICSCGVVHRLWIMYQTLPYGHVEWYRGCG